MQIATFVNMHDATEYKKTLEGNFLVELLHECNANMNRLQAKDIQDKMSANKTACISSSMHALPITCYLI